MSSNDLRTDAGQWIKRTQLSSGNGRRVAKKPAFECAQLSEGLVFQECGAFTNCFI